jgi:DNA-binding response OmpR family regulator
MLRMLIVEDEQDICECLSDFFSSRGFTVVSVFSGEEALERLQQEAADVILLDILLPGLSGIEILKRVRTSNPRAKIVMVTSIDQEDVREQAFYYGAAGYVTKPFDFSTATWRTVLPKAP